MFHYEFAVELQLFIFQIEMDSENNPKSNVPQYVLALNSEESFTNGSTKLSSSVQIL